MIHKETGFSLLRISLMSNFDNMQVIIDLRISTLSSYRGIIWRVQLENLRRKMLSDGKNPRTFTNEKCGVLQLYRFFCQDLKKEDHKL